MTSENIPLPENISFPTQELKAWIEFSYKDQEEEYRQQEAEYRREDEHRKEDERPHEAEYREQERNARRRELQYPLEHKEAHLRAVEEKNIEGLRKLSSSMFVNLSRLQKESPEDWEVFKQTYKKLTEWLSGHL